MKNKVYIDPSTVRKSDELIKSISARKISTLSIIEINLLDKCNRSCSFCPVSDKDFYKINNYNGKMEEDFFQVIVQNLKALNFTGKIIFSGMSEPLIHKKLASFIQELRTNLETVAIEIITNGDLLSLKLLKKLFAAGLDVLNISMYDGDHQVGYFNDMINEAKLDDKQVILRRRYLKDGNYGITFSNRGGAIELSEFKVGSDDTLKLPLSKICYYPFYMLKIDFNGDIHICSHDWQKKGIVGNLNNNTLEDIWNSDKIEFIRKKLSKCDRNMAPCDGCDVIGDVLGKENFDIWKERKNEL